MIQSQDAAKLAQEDTRKYRDLIRRNGGFLSAEATNSIYSFAKSLYSVLGRTDFWLLKQALNIGTGTKVYSFHGEVATLVGNVMWSVKGLYFDTSLSYMVVEKPVYTPNTKGGLFKFGAMSHILPINSSNRTVLFSTGRQAVGDYYDWGAYGIENLILNGYKFTDNRPAVYSGRYGNSASGAMNYFTWDQHTGGSLPLLDKNESCVAYFPLKIVDLAENNTNNLYIDGHWGGSRVNATAAVQPGPGDSYRQVHVSAQDREQSCVTFLMYKDTINSDIELTREKVEQISAAYDTHIGDHKFTEDATARALEQTQNYLATIKSHGVELTQTAINELFEFAKGLYEVAEEEVDFWPLSSKYNVGTGSKAYSFRGNVMDLVNGPSWGLEGITTNSEANQYGRAAIDATPSFTLLSAMRRTGDTSSNPWYFGLGTSSNSNNYLYYIGEGGVGYFGDGPSGSFSPQRTSANNTTNFAFQSFRYENSAAASSVNGTHTHLASVASLESVDVFAFGNRVFATQTGAPSNGEHAFYCVAPPLSDSAIDSLCTLFKSTLGKDLLLP